MRKMLLGSILICGLFATAADGLVGPGSIDNNVNAVTPRDTMLVDTRVGVDPPAWATVSSAFSDIALTTMGADDFTVPDCGWEVTTIRAFGNYSNQLDPDAAGPAESVNVYILPKTGALPTSTDVSSIALWEGTNLPYTELDLVDGGDFEVSIPNVVLPGGDYWLVVTANMTFLSNGQWNWTESSLTPNSGTTMGDESAWFQSANGVQSAVTGNFECVGAWNSRVTGCSMTRNPDTNPPADRDNVFQIEGNILTPGVTLSQSTLTTTEDGSNVTYTVELDAPPTAGATVTVTPSSTDVTEGTVSGALNFTGANWNVPQTVTVTAGASGDGNDGDVMYNLNHAVSTTARGGGACYDGVVAGSIAVTNNNVDGIATIIVDPSSGLTLAEDGSTTFTVTVGDDIAPTADITVNLTVNTPGEVTTDASAVLTAGNGYSVTVTVNGVTDDTVEDPQAFSITTEPSTSGDAAFNGVDPSDVSGTVTDVNTAAVTVTPNATPLSTDETGGTDTIDYVLTAQPASDVTINLSVSDTAEASVAPATLTFTNANWNTPQTVTVTGLDDMVDDDTVSYSVLSSNTSSADTFWDNLPVDSADGENADDTDTAGITVAPTAGLSTMEDGMTTDTFTVVLDTEPIADVVVSVSTDDSTEGLIADDGITFGTTVSLTFDNTNWNVAQTVTVEGQDEEIADGDITYNVSVNPATSDDAKYNGIDGDDVEVTNINDDACGPVTMDVEIGNNIILTGTPGCVIWLIEDLSDGTTNVYGPFTLGGVRGDLGEASVDTGVAAMADAAYCVSTDGGITCNTALAGPIVTVPTLGEWGMIILITLLAGAGIVMKRRAIA